MSANRPILVPLVVVSVATLVAVGLFVVAFIIWLAEFFGSLVAPCLIAGAFMAIIAIVVYAIALHYAFKELRARIDTTYEVLRLLRMGYEWAMSLWPRG